LGRKINDIDFFRSLNGTLLLSSGGRLTDFAADEYGSVEADQRSQLVNIYKEYKAQILIAAVILIIILAYILYIKLAQKPEDTNE